MKNYRNATDFGGVFPFKNYPTAVAPADVQMCINEFIPSKRFLLFRYKNSYPHLTVLPSTAIIASSAGQVISGKRSRYRGYDDTDKTAHHDKISRQGGERDLREFPILPKVLEASRARTTDARSTHQCLH